MPDTALPIAAAAATLPLRPGIIAMLLNRQRPDYVLLGRITKKPGDPTIPHDYSTVAEGGLDRGKDATILGAATRELQEEAGIAPTDIFHLGTRIQPLIYRFDDPVKYSGKMLWPTFHLVNPDKIRRIADPDRADGEPAFQRFIWTHINDALPLLETNAQVGRRIFCHQLATEIRAMQTAIKLSRQHNDPDTLRDSVHRFLAGQGYTPHDFAVAELNPVRPRPLGAQQAAASLTPAWRQLSRA